MEEDRFADEFRTIDNTEEIETAREKYEDLIKGKIDEIKYVKYDDIYEELFEEYSKEYDLKREEGKYWGITITRGEENE